MEQFIYEAIRFDGRVEFIGTNAEFHEHFPSMNPELSINHYYRNGHKLFKKYKIRMAGSKYVKVQKPKKEEPKKDNRDYVYENLLIYGNCFVMNKKEADRVQKKGMDVYTTPSVFGKGYVIWRAG